jgi:Bacterial antitoxin of type II TA system, VapB
MAKEKATITVDRAKLSEARALLGVSSASATIDVALSELIRRHRVALGHACPDWSDLADDTDWDAEWPEVG